MSQEQIDGFFSKDKPQFPLCASQHRHNLEWHHSFDRWDDRPNWSYYTGYTNSVLTSPQTTSHTQLPWYGPEPAITQFDAAWRLETPLAAYKGTPHTLHNSLTPSPSHMLTSCKYHSRRADFPLGNHRTWELQQGPEGFPPSFCVFPVFLSEQWISRRLDKTIRKPLIAFYLADKYLYSSTSNLSHIHVESQLFRRLTLILDGLKDVIYDAFKWDKDYERKSIQDINAIFEKR